MNNNGIRVGYGRKDITPDFSVPLAGYGNTLKRMSQGWLTRIYTTCIAITDKSDNTVLIYTIDVLWIPRNWTFEARKVISAATGIPQENIVFSATHTHSGPDIGSNVKINSEFFNIYVNQAVEAAKEALADRDDAEIKIGRNEVHGLAYERHYVFDNGNIIGDNFGDPKNGKPVAHADETDNDLQLIRFVRGSDRKDVLLVNWQAHPNVSSTGTYRIGRALKPFISADYIDPCRSYVEANCGVHFAFFQGAAGNINPKSMIPEENPTDYYVEYGRQLAGFITEGLEKLCDAGGGEVKIIRRMHTCIYDHSDDCRVEKAKEIFDIWKSENNYLKCVELGKPYDIHSPYHASAIVLRERLGVSNSIELDAIKVGEIAFVTAPYEMFCRNGMYIKDNSPFTMTFILSCANEYNSYFASARAFEHGCYEVDSRHYVKGTAEETAEEFVSMLNEIE